MHERLWGLRADLECVGKQIPVQVARTILSYGWTQWTPFLASQADRHAPTNLLSKALQNPSRPGMPATSWPASSSKANGIPIVFSKAHHRVHLNNEGNIRILLTKLSKKPLW